MVYNIAIVEDDETESTKLKNLINAHPNSKKNIFNIKIFNNAVDFINVFHGEFDVIFFDIQMPELNGMDAAKKVREIDPNVLIIFVTNLERYAIESYAVQAYDFILKPIVYGSFLMKFDRICNQLEKNLDDTSITIVTKSGYRKIRILDISYIEVVNHDLIYHMVTEQEKEFIARGAMRQTEKELKGFHFVRCNSCYLVNLKYVQEIHGLQVVVAGTTLKISQTKKQQFLMEFAKYIGGSAC